MSTAAVRAVLPQPAHVPVGPSVERWRAMSAAERDRFFADVFAAFDVPAEAMAEGRPHRRAKSAAFDALTLHFRSTGRMIYVADELAVIYPGEPTFLPDLLAVLDVPQPDPDEDERMAWVVADEGKGPDLILEVLHQGNRDKDLVKNVGEYARLGIQEYFVYDRLRFKLYGYRLARPGAGYQELRPRLGRLTSAVLGLDLALVGRRLRFFTGAAELPNSEEFIEQLSKMMEGIEARAQQAEAQAQQAEAQAQQAEAQARAAVLDLAEACGLEVTPERRQQVEQASLGSLAALRAALKAGRAWP
jgi:Uma2 family endonuclease